MSCNCRICNNFRNDPESLFGKDVSYSNPVEREESGSVYDRILEVTKGLQKYGAPLSFTRELFSVLNEIDEIDSDVIQLKKDCNKEVELGEISKKLF
jgi:hypothetical protein